MTDNPTKVEVWLIEYQELGEDQRNQASLLNRSYYLSAVVFTILFGSIASLYQSNSWFLASAVSLIGGIGFLFLGAGAGAYHRRRKAASNRKGAVADIIRDQYPESEELLRINQVLSGGETHGRNWSESHLKDIYRYVYGAGLLFFTLAVIFLYIGFTEPPSFLP